MQMKKFLIYIFTFIILFFPVLTTVYAIDVEMDLNSSVNNVDETLTDNNVAQNDTNSPLNNSSTQTTNSPKISTSSPDDDFSLTASDIINIILISVGVVLILLAIAILIKIK